jgi:hypothetical protein
VEPGAACSGRAYFISSGDPRPVREVVNAILAAAGLPPETRSLPLPVAVAAGVAGEALWRLLRRTDDPPMTRFFARQLATAHWFDISAARRDLGYAPQVGLDEGSGGWPCRSARPPPERPAAAPPGRRRTSRAAPRAHVTAGGPRQAHAEQVAVGGRLG